MAIFLDSGIHSEVKEAMAWGFVAGITTNPALLAASGDVSLNALKQLCKMVPGRVFYQLMSRDLDSMIREAQAAFSIGPSQIVLKVPCTLSGLQAVARLSLETPCAVTALFSPAQAYLASEAGARYLISYLNRSTRLLGDGVALVKAMAAVLGNSSTELVAASIKSPAEAVAALNAGADHLAVPFEVIKRMSHHPLTQQALEEFDLAARSSTAGS
jgi:transaldolase